MNANELKSERVRQGKSTQYMADVIGKSVMTYRKKESGEVKFTPDEMTSVANDLNLSPEGLNLIFFDSKLLNSKFCKSEEPLQ